MPLLERDNCRQEKIGGVIYDMSPSAGWAHGIVNINILGILTNALKGSLCRVFMENQEWHYDEEENYVLPDIMIVCDTKNRHKGKYKGVPKFIIETLSPSTALRDRTMKKDIYERKGVEEYWIINPVSKEIEIHYLKAGKYELCQVYTYQGDPEIDGYNAEECIKLKSFPNIQMALKDIFEDVEE